MVAVLIESSSAAAGTWAKREGGAEGDEGAGSESGRGDGYVPEVGSTVRARAECGPACESSSAREAGVRFFFKHTSFASLHSAVPVLKPKVQATDCAQVQSPEKDASRARAHHMHGQQCAATRASRSVGSSRRGRMSAQPGMASSQLATCTPFFSSPHLFTTAPKVLGPVPVHAAVYGLGGAGWEAAVGGCLQPACVSQQPVQSTSSTELCGSRKLEQRSGEGFLRGNGDDATPTVHPSGLSSAAHGDRCASSSGLREKSEGRGFLAPAPTNFNAEHDKAAAASTEQLRILGGALVLVSEYGGC